MKDEVRDLVEDLERGFDGNPEESARELERMKNLCDEAADQIRKLSARIEYMDSDPFNVLNRINVNDHVEKKNNLSYLSWAWAWQILMGLYPMSYTSINRSPEGLPYWTDGKTCWVDVSVTIVWDNHHAGKLFETATCERTRNEIFPIMDYKNNSIPVEKVTSFNVNTALQRAWTKCIARHGLGFYIYAGEDLPKDEAEARMAEKAEAADTAKMAVEYTTIRTKLSQLGVDLHGESFVNFVKQAANVSTIDPGVLLMDAEGMRRVIAVMNDIAQKKAK